MEFGVKLGYTVNQVQTALCKIGNQADQNELLAELIKLGASASNEPQSNTDHETQSVVPSPANLGCLRPIIIDGSNVAMSHGNNEVFSCLGLRICVEWFKARGHTNVQVWVPSFRKESSRAGSIITDQEILFQLEREKHLFWTPSRSVGGRRVTCYDDRYILTMAAESDGIVVSNDSYRDLVNERPEFKKVVEERLLMYTFANDRFMPPDDPLGRKGPSLDSFLRFPMPEKCPYDKKCTYGNKCKYYHPERGNQPQKTVTQKLLESAKNQIQQPSSAREMSPGQTRKKVNQTTSLPPTLQVSDYSRRKKELCRTKSVIPAPTVPHHMPMQDSFARRRDPRLGFLNPGSVPNQRFASSSCANLNLGTFRDPSDHTNITKRLSDPEKPSSAAAEDQFFAELLPSNIVCEEASSNLHRKLQRQLTLNPNCDPRLSQAAERVQPLSCDPQSRLRPIGSHRQPIQRLHSEPRSFSSDGSDDSNHLYNPFTLCSTDACHQNVSRIASAPDEHLSWSLEPQDSRLNSSSDSRLHLTPSPPNFGVVRGPIAPFPGDSIWSPVGPTLYGNNWSQLPSVRPVSVHEGDSPLSPRTASQISSRPTKCSNEAPVLDREKLYYHLSSIFPEEQVRTVMEMNPQETNAQPICAAILNMFPKG